MCWEKTELLLDVDETYLQIEEVYNILTCSHIGCQCLTEALENIERSKVIVNVAAASVSTTSQSSVSYISVRGEMRRGSFVSFVH